MFAFHLIPILMGILVVNVFGMYSIFKFLRISGTAPLYLATAYFVAVHFILMILTAHTGSTTSRQPEILIEMIAKLINELSLNHPSRYLLYNYIKQFQTRNFKFQALFLTINWNIVLGVRFTLWILFNHNFKSFLNFQTTATTMTYLIIM